MRPPRASLCWAADVQDTDAGKCNVLSLVFWDGPILRIRWLATTVFRQEERGSQNVRYDGNNNPAQPYTVARQDEYNTY